MRIMRRIICALLIGDFLHVLSIALKDTPTLGTEGSPRVLSQDVISCAFEYQSHQNHTVFFYQEDAGELYVGGTDFVLKLDADDCHVVETFNLTTTGQQQCKESPCKNVITVIEKFQDSLFVCGTNGNKPQCWKLFSSVDQRSSDIVESYEGTGISPFTHTQNSLSLTVDDDLYSAAPLEKGGSLLQFRRKVGIRTNVWMYDSWVSEPTFISASRVRRKEDPDNEKIYIFFREKNSDHNPEADPWISRVARVCKVDQGGSKRFFQNIWTTFLKARLVCGFPEESLYFNRLLDIYVMDSEDWPETRVYALFTSSWNSTAVCVYSVGMIEDIFENSTFKGYDKEIPKPRPGTCVRNSRTLPHTTLSTVRDHPEMTDWVHPMHAAPFYISTNNYSKIAVDRVQTADHQMYNVLLLSTDTGKVHKVLEAGSKPFIISETQLSSSSTIRSMHLDSRKKKLVVGFSEKIFTMDLQRCQDYNKSCEDCVLARDPYCAWTESGCGPTVPGGIQNMDGDQNVCHVKEERQTQRVKRQTASAVDMSAAHSVPLGVPFYLSCPIDSYHAKYTWEHGSQTSPCLQMQSNCLHLIPSMTQDDYGTYKCISRENGYEKTVEHYQLAEQKIPPPPPPLLIPKGITEDRNGASAVSPHIWTNLGLALAVMGNFR